MAVPEKSTANFSIQLYKNITYTRSAVNSTN